MVSTVGANTGEVYVYDSLYSKTTNAVTNQITCLLHTK